MSEQKVVRILQTDLEPDDWVFLMIACQMGWQYDRVIMTESEPNVVPYKGLYFRRHFSKLGVYNQLMLGDYSNKKYRFKYPYRMSSDDQMFVERYQNQPDEVVAECERDLVSLLSQNDLINYVCISPPRMLFRIYLNPATKHLLKKVTIWFYGSFNFRTMYAEDLQPTEKELFFQFLNTGFKEAYTYETHFAIGPDNTVDATNTPGFYDWVTKHRDDPFIGGMSYLVDQWNQNILMHIVVKSLSVLHPGFKDQDYDDKKKENVDLSHVQQTPEVRQLCNLLLLFYNEMRSGKTLVNLSCTPQDVEFVKHMSTTFKEMEFDGPDAKAIAGLHRNLKIVGSILNSPLLQIVCADVGLGLTMAQTDPKSLFVPVRVGCTDRNYIALSDPQPGDSHHYLMTKDEHKRDMMVYYDRELVRIMSVESMAKL